MQSTIITPSTKLVCVNTHKLQDLACDRLYFWRWVLNLVPRKLNIAFWFGSMMHYGLEYLAWGKTYKYTIREITKKSVAYLKKQPPMAADVAEVGVQFEIIKIILKVYSEIRVSKMKGLILGGTELHMKKQLAQSSVLWVGTLDAYYFDNLRAGKKLVLLEGKTAKSIDNDYFARLKFDKQINGYAMGLKEVEGCYPSKCYYTAFRKPAIRPRKKQKETLKQFLIRLEEDLHERQDWYFITYPHRFGKQSIAAVVQDVEWLTFDLWAKYNYLSCDKILDPACWPRNDKKCFEYGTCPYFILCKHYDNYPLYFRFFMMRDIRYDEEQQELNPQRKFSTKQQHKLKGYKHVKAVTKARRKGKARVSKTSKPHRLRRRGIKRGG